MVAENATSLRRGLAILFALENSEAARNGGLGVTRIAELTGREKSQVSRSLKTLAELGLVDRDPGTLSYRLGWRVFRLAARAADQYLIEAAPQFLRRLVAELEERAHLSVLQGSEVMTVLSESPNRAVEATGWVGRTVPVYCTSSGRALLFDHDRAELGALLAEVEFETCGPNMPASVDELYERIVAASAEGFALVDEEFEPGLVAAAAPVRDFRGRLVAALNVSAPKFRFEERLGEAGAAVKRAADELSHRLGSIARNGAGGG